MTAGAGATETTAGVPSLLATLSVGMSLYPGTPYNYSATAQGIVFTAGACPLDEHGTVVAPGDFEAQALRAVENLLAALSTHDIGPESVLKTTVFVVAGDRSDLVRVWDVVSSRLGRVPSTLLGVSLMGYPNWSRSRRSRRSNPALLRRAKG
ncbi:MAG TPA: RidA family protein [Solirubrobacteraceae bacterium]|nr:RidA family protein [Solirubrobacteraceae bacterium]